MDGLFWRGLAIALPISLFLWGLIWMFPLPAIAALLAGVIIWPLL